MQPDAPFLSAGMITDLLVNNRVQHPLAPESVLKQNFNETRTLSLNYNQTNIAISYTCSNFIYPDNNTFFYKMDGVDEEWIDANNRKTVYSSKSAWALVNSGITAITS